MIFVGFVGIEDTSISEFNLVFGTSASAPTTASIITLINDARLAIGKKPVGMFAISYAPLNLRQAKRDLGFINPAIYSAPFRFAFNDITSGGNQGCGTYIPSTSLPYEPILSFTILSTGPCHSNFSTHLSCAYLSHQHLLII